MKAKLCTGIIAATVFFFLSTGKLLSSDVVIRTDYSGEKCVIHGAAKLADELKLKKLDAEVSETGTGDKFTVYVGTRDSAWAVELEAAGISLPDVSDKPESYITRIFRNAAPPVAVALALGADAVGAMYAAYDLADQVSVLPPGVDVFSYLVSNKREAYLPIRAVNPFLHVEAFQDQDSWYYDESFWTDYLDLLSRSRYNLIDFHGMYEIKTTWFPNAYLYLEKSEKFPDAGVSPEQAKKNLDMFNRIIGMARDRGIRVSLMSYHAGWALTSGGEEKPHAPSEEELEAYTREVVAKIIRDCPDLWMIGFRIGESGKQESFYEKSYIAGIADSGRVINMFTRSWGAVKSGIDKLAETYPGDMYLEIKYNGEQLGLPYMAITDTQDTNPGYSWQAYLDRPRKYKVLWQIRANGTHRMARWGDPDFVSRAVRVSNFQDSYGFSIEPFTSYYPMTDFIFRKDGKITYKWDHQRNWFWYSLWGRLGYDPDIPESQWVDMFRVKYGGQAGPVMYRAMVAGSRLVPLIYSYRCMGYDHRDMAPEFEFGGTLEDYIAEKNYGISVLNDRKKYMSPLDPNVMAPITGFVDESMSIADGEFLRARMSPYDVADELDKYAGETMTALAEAALISKKDETDYQAMRAELMAVVNMSRYYAEKIRAATAYSFYKKTNSWYDLVEAERLVKSAQGQWGELAKHGKKYFRPLIDTLRMKTMEFTWEEEGKKLQQDLDIISAEKKRYLDAVKAAKNYAVYIHSELRPVAGKALEIKANALALKGGEKLVINFRSPDGKEKNKDFSKISGTQTGFKVTLPAEWMAGGEAAFFVELQKGKTVVARFPEKGAVKMLVSVENKKPEIFVDAVQVTAERTYRVFASVIDDTGVKNVRLRYKPMPSESSWAGKPMKHIGGTTYVADLPVNPGGWIYYILASDENGNAAAYPDYRKSIPYIAIESYDPAKGPSY